MKDADISKCNFSIDVVPYMYGEMSPAGISAFESHLLECDECTDELAAVSFARYEVYDWKKLEFDPLPTPRILPFQDPVAVHAGVSWFDALRAAFSGRLVPTAGFALVAIALVYGGVVYLSRDNGATISRDNGPTITQGDDVAPTVSELKAPITPVVDKPKLNESRKAEPKVVKAVTSRNTTQRRSVPIPKKNVVRPVEAVAKTAPRLNEFTDDEDKSLRLAMLFDDLDTRD
jgi:hypothetical protein